MSLFGSLISGFMNLYSNAMQIDYQREANKQNIALQRETNAANLQQVRETNAANAAMVREQNAAAAAESEKARAYDSAVSQVSRLRAAGMSKAGALGTINGAGGYTPAPVNVSQAQAAQAQAPQVQAPQIDLTGVSNAIQGFMQLKEQKRQFDETMQEQKRVNDSSIKAQDLKSQEQELLNSSNDETRKTFPSLRSYLNSISSEYEYNLGNDSSISMFDTNSVWSKMESDNKQLHDMCSRNTDLRNYVDDWLAMNCEDKLNALGFNVSYERAQAIRQQVKEYLSKENVGLREKRIAIDYLVTEYEERRLKSDGFNNPFSSWSDFRLFVKSLFGSKTAETLLEVGEQYVISRFKHRK